MGDRLLILGLQSSGASSLAFFLGQRSQSIAIVDVWNSFLVPYSRTNLNVVAKVVITQYIPFNLHVDNFRPTAKLLLLRNPIDNFLSLRSRSYAGEGGTLEEKFKLIDKYFTESNQFDCIIHYEDFVCFNQVFLESMRALGWPIFPEYLYLPRSPEKIQQFTLKKIPQSFRQSGFGFGNYDKDIIKQKTKNCELTKTELQYIRDKLIQYCPNLMNFYEGKEFSSLNALCESQKGMPISCSRDFGSINFLRLLSTFTSSLENKEFYQDHIFICIQGANRECKVHEDGIFMYPNIQDKADLRISYSGSFGSIFNRVLFELEFEPSETERVFKIFLENKKKQSIQRDYFLGKDNANYIVFDFSLDDLSLVSFTYKILASKSVDNLGVRVYRSELLAIH